MSIKIAILESGESRYKVFDGDLLLACFGSKAAAEEYAQLLSKNRNTVASVHASNAA